MIKVNLLPFKRRKKPKPVPPFLIISVLLLTVAMVTLFYTAYFLDSKITMLEIQKADNAGRIAELDEKVKEVEDFESLNEKFTKRKNIIEQLTKNQSVPVKILDEMSSRLSEGVWLNSMSIARGKISITGVGFSNHDIVSFVQSLKDSKLFKDVTLLMTRKTRVEGTDAYMFKMTLQVHV